MPENKDASLPATTGGSTQNAALLRPARLPLSAYPASPPASRVPNTGQSSTIQGPTHIADTGTCVSTAANNAPDDGSRLATGRRLYQKLQRLYWTEDKHANEYNQYDPGCGPEGEGAETRREEVSQIMESFCVYDENSSDNKGRDKTTRAQAQQAWNVAAASFLTAQTQDIGEKRPDSG